MQPADRQRYRQMLDHLLARLLPDVLDISEQTHAACNGRGAHELSNAPFHLGDIGTEEFLFDMNAVLLENEEYLTNEVQAALERIDQEAFGVCERCGRGIAKERLQAIPYARHCIKCAQVAGSAPDVNVNIGRPRRPSDMLAPAEANGEFRSRNSDSVFTDRDAERAASLHSSDVHAAGTPGGGGASGGLAGTNEGRGDPNYAELEETMGSSAADMLDARDDNRDEPKSGRSGGAVGGTPAGKRAR